MTRQNKIIDFELKELRDKFGDFAELVRDFYHRNPGYKIAYGGDGEILRAVAEFRGKDVGIIPIRNYGQCKAHKSLLKKVLTTKSLVNLPIMFDMQICRRIAYWKTDVLEPVIEHEPIFYKHIDGEDGIAEIAIKSTDITSALRFNFYVNGMLYMKNVIADGLVASTKFGSTGYFKSVARCIMGCESLGIAFIAPSQGISNIILDAQSYVEIEFLRGASVSMSADKQMSDFYAHPGQRIKIASLEDPELPEVRLYGLSTFQCQECRAGRNSIFEAGVPVQDKYIEI